MDLINQLRHKIATNLLNIPTIEDWETETDNTPYPITLKTGLTAVTREDGETDYYTDSTTIVQEHPTGPSYTAITTHQGEIIAWHNNPIAITTE